MPDEKIEHQHSSVHHYDEITTSRDITHEHVNGSIPHSHDVADTSVFRELVHAADEPAKDVSKISSRGRSKLWYGDS
jgi:hypothetical protein